MWVGDCLVGWVGMYDSFDIRCSTATATRTRRWTLMQQNVCLLCCDDDDDDL